MIEMRVCFILCISVNEILINHKLTQQEMANFIGYSRQTVNAAITSFKKEEIISVVAWRKLLIKDIERLKEYQNIKK